MGRTLINGKKRWGGGGGGGVPCRKECRKIATVKVEAERPCVVKHNHVLMLIFHFFSGPHTFLLLHFVESMVFLIKVLQRIPTAFRTKFKFLVVTYKDQHDRVPV